MIPAFAGTGPLLSRGRVRSLSLGQVLNPREQVIRFRGERSTRFCEIGGGGNTLTATLLFFRL